MSSSKRVLFSIILIAFLASACGSLPSKGGDIATATSAPAFTPNPPTVTPTSTLEFVPVTDIPTPLPTPQPPPILTPDAIQVERWREYQTELAKALLYGYDIDPSKDALCEWDILGRSDQEVYVWAYCSSIFGGRSLPAVIHLDADESIQEVNAPAIDNSTWNSQIQALFPPDVQEKFDLYTGNSLFNGRLREMINHLDYRKTHPEEPPLAILSAPTP